MIKATLSDGFLGCPVVENQSEGHMAAQTIGHSFIVIHLFSKFTSFHFRLSPGDSGLVSLPRASTSLSQLPFNPAWYTVGI